MWKVYIIISDNFVTPYFQLSFKKKYFDLFYDLVQFFLFSISHCIIIFLSRTPLLITIFYNHSDCNVNLQELGEHPI